MHLRRMLLTKRRFLITLVTCLALTLIAQLSSITAGGPQVLSTPYHERHQYFKDTLIHTPKHLAHEFGAVSHHDARFLSPDRTQSSNPGSRRALMTGLLSSYFETMDRLGIKETWVAHGTLLGHHWGQHILPWDTDIDVQMSASDMAHLVQAGYNVTVNHVKLVRQNTASDETASARYLLDINPYWTTPWTTSDLPITWDVANKIDARWIDMSNGKFIDITVVHESPSGTVLRCKDGHKYLPASIYPLAASTLDGIEVRVPADSKRILADEYGKAALTNKRHHW